tara:strand:- start:401 stop:637 length:237 start_codon:yes stop_codon:yes gene_type:complete
MSDNPKKLPYANTKSVVYTYMLKCGWTEATAMDLLCRIFDELVKGDHIPAGYVETCCSKIAEQERVFAGDLNDVLKGL